MKNKKRRWFQLVLIGSYLVYLIGMNESHAAENSKVTVGFYEEKKKESHKTNQLPQTGEESHNNSLQVNGISILLVITGMISYRTLMKEERI